MIIPTQEELFNEELESVHREADDSWRHGSYVTEVFYRESDNTFWETNYSVSTDGETHGLRDGEYSIVEVFPQSKTVTVYVEKKDDQQVDSYVAYEALLEIFEDYWSKLPPIARAKIERIKELPIRPGTILIKKDA